MKKYLFIIIISSIVFSCKKSIVENIDLTPSTEVAPTLKPDSPMWKALKPPSTVYFTNTGYKTNVANMFTGVMWKQDTLSDHLKVDDISAIEVSGNIDANTVVSGSYYPQSDFWQIKMQTGVPRYSALMLGTFAVTGRYELVGFFSLIGSGYAINENFPNGISYFNDIWMQKSFYTGEQIKENTLLTGFMANNHGYFFENDANKQMWHINNSQIYDKRTPFPGDFLGKIVTGSAKVKDKYFGYALSESVKNGIKTKDFYQYDVATDTWTKKADFAGEDRKEGTMFGIDDKIYYGLGQSKTEAKGFRDIWQYDPQTDKWTNFATYPGGGNVKNMTALVSGKVYIGMGYYVGKTSINSEKYVGATDFWEFVPSRK